jgi:hypothetical protein
MLVQLRLQMHFGMTRGCLHSSTDWRWQSIGKSGAGSGCERVKMLDIQDPGAYLFARRLKWIGISAKKQANDQAEQPQHRGENLNNQDFDESTSCQYR